MSGPQSAWWAGVYRVTQGYGCTSFAFEGHNPHHPECAYWHDGIDYALPCRTPIVAGRACVVEAIDPPGYGPVGDSAAIRLGVGSLDVWLYHMNDYAVHVGQRLVAGQLIGHSGTRGYSTGCHLHFEVRPNGAPYRVDVNPLSIIVPSGAIGSPPLPAPVPKPSPSPVPAPAPLPVPAPSPSPSPVPEPLPSPQTPPVVVTDPTVAPVTVSPPAPPAPVTVPAPNVADRLGAAFWAELQQLLVELLRRHAS